jgi:hypothetical protein
MNSQIEKPGLCVALVQQDLLPGVVTAPFHFDNYSHFGVLVVIGQWQGIVFVFT